MELTTCPECGLPAAIRWRCVMESTAGPVEHCKIGCVGGHHFLLPVARLAPAAPHVTAGRTRALPAAGDAT